MNLVASSCACICDSFLHISALQTMLEEQKTSAKDMLARLDREADEMAKERVLEKLANEKEEALVKKTERMAEQRAREKVTPIYTCVALWPCTRTKSLTLLTSQRAAAADRLAAVERQRARTKAASSSAESRAATSSSNGARVTGAGRVPANQVRLQPDNWDTSGSDSN